MKNLIKISFSFIILLSACTHTIPPAIDYKSLTKELSIGMTKEEVIKIFGMPASKEINGKKETYYFYSKSQTTATTEVLDTLGTLILSPVGTAIGRDPISVRTSSSSYTLYFDENGRLERF